MNHVRDLRKNMVDVFQDVKNDKMEVSKAKALVATSNMIVKTAKLELDHAKFSGSKKEIKFLK